jgi:sporulation integral membrane protein YlbJ
LELVGISLFGSSLIGFLLFFTHILGCLTVGFLFRFWKKNKEEKISYNTSKSENKLQNISVSSLGEVLGESISSAISTILMIGGFVVLFSVIISILNASGITNLVSLMFEPICNFFGLPSKISSSIFTGILEITNGINLIAGIKLKHISVNIIITAFLLGIGGISILLQVLSIVSKSDLSIKPYIIGKILHGTFAAVYTFLIIQFFPMFNFNL